MTTVVDELCEALIESVVGLEWLSALHLGPDFSWFKSIEGYLALYNLPQERAEGEYIDLLIVLAFLKQLWCHVAGSSSVLHRSRAQISLHKELKNSLEDSNYVLTMKRARPKSQTFTL